MGFTRRVTGDFDARLARIELLMNRAEEIKQIAEDQRFDWIAGQMDEFHAELLTIRDEFYAELLTIREEVQAMKRLLTGGLIGILTGVIVIPIALLWAAGISG